MFAGIFYSIKYLYYISPLCKWLQPEKNTYAWTLTSQVWNDLE